MNEFPRSLYIHIPFCKRRCFYCDFAITTGGQSLVNEYLTALCEEIHLTARILPPDRPPLETIFLGGGTPSLLEPQEIDRILTLLSSYWEFESNIEISLEANPGTVTAAKLVAYKSSGVNRISMGAQSFQDSLLDLCGRGHNAAQIYEAIAAIKEAEITNFSLDLISGLPQQTMNDWQYSLEQTIELNPTHISVYDLTIEPGTAFGKRFQPGQLPLPSESLTVDMFHLAHERLTQAGYHHYEISNYCLPGFACRHNLTYWQNRSFYGMGMGATSYVNSRRWDRPRKMREYLTTIETWKNRETPPEIPIVSIPERLFDRLMQGLRLAEGIEIDTLYVEFGKELVDRVEILLRSYADRGWVSWDQSVRLIPLEGWIFSEVMIADLYNLLLE